MNNEQKKELEPDQLLEYLSIAARFRHQEYNIQMLRNVLYTGSEAFLIACYAATIKDVVFVSLVVAIFGAVFSLLWSIYYRSSIYWTTYWEQRTKEINDYLIKKVISNVNLFKDHPAGSFNNKPTPIKFWNRLIKHKEIHNLLQATQVAFLVLWIALSITAWCQMQKPNKVQKPLQNKTNMHQSIDSSKPLNPQLNSLHSNSKQNKD